MQLRNLFDIQTDYGHLSETFQLILQSYDLCQLLEGPNSISIVIQKNPELEFH